MAARHVTPAGRGDRWQRPTTVGYVVCDVDGTLVGPEAVARPAVADAVARLQSAGVRVGYATGRMRDAVAPLHEQLGGHGPHLLFNGAEVRIDGRTINSWPLPAGTVARLLRLVQHRDDAYLELYTDTGYVASELDERAAPHWEILGAPPRAVITDAAQLGTEPVLKATFAVFEPAAVTELVAAVRSLGLAAGTAGSPRTPGLTYLNATHPEADKGRALTYAADHLGIPLHEVVVVGDAPNDLPMFAVAGTAIAMGQAEPAVHAAAHLAVPAVDQDGVVVALDTVGSWLAA